jgi:uncharacterized OB-fold protein
MEALLGSLMAVFLVLFVATLLMLHSKPPNPQAAQPTRPIAINHCIECGAQVIPHSRYCGNCGSALGA